MIIERADSGAWLASGEGPLRPILSEATTRAVALQGWTEMFSQQYAEGEAMTATSELNDLSSLSASEAEYLIRG